MTKTSSIYRFYWLAVQLVMAFPLFASAQSAIIHSIAPSSGSSELIIKIEGENFSEDIQIYFGGIRVDWMYRKSSELVYAVAPDQAQMGPVHITLQTHYGLSENGPQDVYTYTN